MTQDINKLIDDIDAVLPQTQCGLCGYGACRPYAQAIAVNNDQINRCPPGGVLTLRALAQLTDQDPGPWLEAMHAKVKPLSRAVIREEECIGCTKCLQVCPVDAILGSAKKMHTVIAQECTGCELCLEPCPVDCIDIIAIAPSTPIKQKQKADQFRERYLSRQRRLAKINTPADSTSKNNVKILDQTIVTRKTAITAAISRANAKRLKPDGNQ